MISPRSQSRTALVLTYAKEYLGSTGRRAQSPTLLQEMKRRGVEFPEGNEVETLASILSASDMFDNVRGQGYGLAEWAVQTGVVPPNGSGAAQPPATGAPAE